MSDDNDTDHQFLLLHYLRCLQAVDKLSVWAADKQVPNPKLKEVLLGGGRLPNGTTIQYILRKMTKPMYAEILRKVIFIARREFDLLNHKCVSWHPAIMTYKAKAN